jgi:hypothetical protein
LYFLFRSCNCPKPETPELKMQISLGGFGGVQLLYVPLVPLALAAEALSKRKQERNAKKELESDPKHPLDKALLKDSKNHRLFFQRALISAAKEDWKAAIEDLSSSLELQPNDYQV